MADPLVVHTQLHLKSLALSVNAATLSAKTQHSKPNKKESEELEKIKQEKVKNEHMEGGERDKEEPIKPPFVTSGDGAGVVGRMTKVKVSALNCFSQIELDEFFSRLGARILAVDMLPFMQPRLLVALVMLTMAEISFLHGHLLLLSRGSLMMSMEQHGIV
ncbi:hypothetical protein MKX01_032347 [Papaver californicum]|nr:hypothetical protein MKX01_032347 [Papaver californicum]